MNIAYHLYQLKGRNRFQDRHGALLRIDFGDAVGYADCHPWEELGDLPLGQQLNLLRIGELTALTKQSVHFAKVDSEARAEGKNLFTDLKIPESHWLFSGDPDELVQIQDFSRIKVKFHEMVFLPILEQLFDEAPQQIKFRIDCNAKFSWESIQPLLRLLAKQKERVDFIEDPIPWDSKQWGEIEEIIPVAADRAPATDVGIRVVKPAVQDSEAVADFSGRIVVTSYLDHPLGQLSAAYSAAKLGEKADICGLLSHVVYQPNPFSEQLRTKGPLLIPPMGTGFGYDAILDQLEWSPLR